ncbi:MAG: hypothetical protein RL464_887, partial [Actinomycetota bacterium]
MNVTSSLPNWAIQSIQLLLIIFLGLFFRYLLQRSLRLFIKRLIQLREDESPESHASRG